MADIKRKSLLSKNSKLPVNEKNPTLEDLLATDSLFIEYFNAFLTLPAFPEPLQFNRETGGFEIVNDAKRHLASEIKAAVRSSRRRKKIYRPVHNHSYSAIPLVPIEDPKPEEEREIDTSFTIKSLNREQGIEWIKKERMPAFLESDVYVEYRLSKVISQAQLAYQGDHAVSMKLDYTPPPPKEHEVEEEEEELVEDPKEALMKNMYVSLGNTSATDTEAWVSQAQSLLTTACTSVMRTRPTSAIAKSPRARSARGRPVSAASSAKSPGKSTASDRDSGFCSPSKNSEADLSVYASADGSVDGEHLARNDKNDRVPETRPVGPRPSDTICVLAEERGDVEKGGRVYNTPRLPSPTESGEEDGTLDDDDSKKQSSTTGGGVDPTDSTAAQPIKFGTVDELGAMVVGTAMKHALCDISGMTLEQLERHPEFQGILPIQEHLSLTKHQLNQAAFLLGSEPPSEGYTSIGKQESSDQNQVEGTGTQSTKAGDNDIPTLALGKEDKESDEDSLLNSDEDYEDERDDFFHRRKAKVHDLLSRKGMTNFKDFLKGTHGEKYWNLWLDIERAKLIKDQDEQTNFVLAIRERYEKQGGVYELGAHSKEQLGLVAPSHWVLDGLTRVQTKLAEPLILYWAPRFMIKQKTKVNPDSHYLYHQQKLITPHTEVTYPNPPVAPLLPLRPKNCAPRVQQYGMVPPKQVEIQDMFAKESDASETQLSIDTSPLVGNRRVYELPDMFAPFKTEKEEKDKNNNKRKSQKGSKKTPRQLITPKIQPELTTGSLPGSRSNSRAGSRSDVRPPSAPAGRSKSARSGSQSLKDAWGSLSSLTSSTSVRRPSSPDSRRSSLSEASEMSEFTGGRRMEGLLQALASEQKSGSFFRKHVEKSANKWWKNCLEFWLDLQTYHQIFYSEVLDPFALRRKAKHLYSRYIVVGAPSSVQCEIWAREQVFRQIEPPFEELFDPVEEHVLTILYEAWMHSLNEDIATFDKVELTEIKRHLNTKSRYVMSLQKRGIIKERPETPEDSLENYQDPVYDETLWENIPEEYREFTLERLVHNRLELEHFRQFLAENYANMDLLCWMDIEAFRRIPHTEEKRRDMKAKDIKVKYFNKKYFFGANSPAGKEGQEKIMEAGGGWGKLLQDRPPTACLLEAQKYVRERLEKKWLPLFLATEGFADRQRPKSGMSDIVEDVMIQRKKKSQAIWKMLESKWVSSSKDILTFRKALSNPVTSFHFRRFLSAKARSDHFFENDVLFWQEVQRYKDLCHIHSDRSLVQQKTSAIVNCFIDSPIPPSLQVDITQEMADKIMDRKLEATPYLFREAQLTVFRMLFTRWQEFCQFRNNLAEDKILPTLERLRTKNMMAERKRMRELEERREKENGRRRELGLPVEGAEGEDAEARSDVDPFERLSRGSDDGSMDNSDKKSVTWSYSQYMRALDEEQVMNEVDDTTFSSLTLNTQGVDTVLDDTSELGDKVSLANSARGSRMDGDLKKTKRETKKIAKLEEDDKITKPLKVTKSKVDTSETGSQTDLKAKKPPTRPPSPKEQNKGPKSDGKTNLKDDPPKANDEGQGGRPMDKVPPEAAPVQPRLVRKIPPLVGKR